MADRKKNPANAQHTLFRQLTRLFSGPIVNYRRQLPRQLKRRQLDKYKFKSASGQEFKKASMHPYEQMQANYFANQNRADRYTDFDQMEYMPELASALDIYADEMTTSSELRNLLDVKCSNEEIKNVLHILYHNILNVEHNLFGWCRSMCKYGDFFLYLDIDDEEGIKYAMGLPPHEVERLEGEDKQNPSYIQYQWNTAGLTFENWQMGHFRILGNDKYAPYGTSVLEAARRIWRQLTLLEDAMIAYRIVRSPERRVFYIDVGNVAPQEVEQYVQRVMTQMKRNQLVDSSNGRVDLRYNPMSIEEDYYIPVRGTNNTRVESLPGGTYTGDVDDVKYLRDKLFSAIKIPAAYLSQTENQDDQTTLAQKDIRFARTVQRLQRSVVSELEKLGVVHLFTLGYRGNDLTSFKLSLNNPSKLAELQELEHWRTRFEIASSATEGYFSKRWVSEHMFGLTPEEMLRIQREVFHDKQLEAALESVVEEATAAASPLGGIGGEEPGGVEDILGDEEPGEEGLGAEEPAAGEPAAEEPPGGEDEGVLLAAPAKRDDGPTRAVKKNVHGDKLTTTAKSKGKWYSPKKDDKRDMGARRRSLTKTHGAKDLLSLGKLRGITEELESIYDISEEKIEEKIFETNNDIKRIIEGLESKEK